MTTPAGRSTTPEDVELVIARLLLAGTIVGVVLLSIGVGLMITNGVDPESATFPAFDPGTIVSDMAALRPEGYLWAGIVILIATPIVRVAGELVVFATRGDRVMAIVALAILGVVALSVAAARFLEV